MVDCPRTPERNPDRRTRWTLGDTAHAQLDELRELLGLPGVEVVRRALDQMLERELEKVAARDARS